MQAFLSILSLFAIVVGVLTFRSSSEWAAETADNGDLWLSSILIVAGLFCLSFFNLGGGSALIASAACSLVLLAIHSAISYSCRKLASSARTPNRTTTSSKQPESTSDTNQDGYQPKTDLSLEGDASC